MHALQTRDNAVQIKRSGQFQAPTKRL